MKKFIFYIILILSFNNLSLAADSPTRLKILLFITGPNGEVDKTVHKIFWEGVDTKDLDSAVGVMFDLKFYGARIEFFKEFWECVLISYDEKKVYKTKNYFEAKKSFDLVSNKNLYSDTELKGLTNELHEEYMNRTLQAAASNSTSYITDDLKRIDWNRKYIQERVIQSLIILNRFEKLSDPYYYD